MESVENVTPIRKYRARRAGESLDTRVSYLLGLSVFALAAFCFLAGALTGRRILPADQDLDHIYLAIMLVCLAAFIAIALKLDRQYRNAVLGREGEREVGAQLDELERHGARILHDVQAARFNLDHVVFHTSGIYAVETKTWTTNRTGISRLRFDGKSIWKGRFRTRTDPSRQAIRQAVWLKEHLASMGLNLKDPVRAVVVFPGWKINVERHNPLVQVMNPWDLCSFIRTSSHEALSPKQVAYFHSKLREQQAMSEKLSF